MRVMKGDLFTNDTNTIGHGVNCAGVMGAGIAKPIREKYPNNFSNYRAACRRGLLVPGKTMVNVENDTVIFNIASQNKPGRDARYDWLFGAALDAAEQAVAMDLDTIALPMIGCGIGGLEGYKVLRILETIEYMLNDGNRANVFQWEVWRQ